MLTTRRKFIERSVISSIALGAPSIVKAGQNRQYRTALVGSGWWGMNITRVALQSGQCKLVAMCDVDRNQLDPAVTEVESLTGDSPKKYGDYRELLEREKPEIVIVATPDHWHPLVTIAAVQAGADVYVEKPVGHTVLEGRAMLRAARETGRIVQVGLHRRVSPHNVSGMKFLKEGRAGTIGMVRAFVHQGGGRGRIVPDSDPPAGLDWDMWCGPAPLRPFNKSIHPKGFRQYLDYANGVLGDWGVHWMDHIMWWTEEKHPKRVYSTGGRHIRHDSTDAPDTQIATYEFESFTATWEHRRYAANNAEKHSLGCYFYGTEGTFHMGWKDGWTFYPANSNKPVIHEEPTLHLPDNQNILELWTDFLRCVKSRQLPVCDIDNGYRSTNMSLLGMLSYKLGRSIRWDGEKAVITGDPEANGLLRREYRKPWVYPDAFGSRA